MKIAGAQEIRPKEARAGTYALTIRLLLYVGREKCTEARSLLSFGVSRLIHKRKGESYEEEVQRAQ